MKKLLIGFVAVVVFLLIIVLVAPFIVDLNKYRPAIKTIVEKNINGTFDIGKIELTILSGFGAKVTDVSIKSTKKFQSEELFRVGTVRVRASIFSIFTGLSDINILIDKPSIKVITNASGQMNVQDIVKQANQTYVPAVNDEQKPAAKDKQVAKKETPVSKQEEASDSAIENKVLDIVKRIVINVNINKASLALTDQKLKSNQEINNINVEFKNIRLGNKFSFSVSSDLDLSQGKELILAGQIKANGEILANVKDSRPSLNLTGKFDLTGLTLKIPDTIEKTSTDKFTVDFSVILKNDDPNQYELIVTKDVELFLTMLLNKQFKDKLNLKATVNSKLDLNFVPLNTDLSVSFNAKATDLTLRAKLNKMDTLNFNIKSSMLNLDEFMDPPETLVQMITNLKKTGFGNVLKSTKATETPQKGKEEEAQGKATVQDADPLRAVRENPLLMGFKANGDVTLARIVVVRSEISNLLLNMSLSKLKLVASITLNAFKGNINAGNLTFDMAPKDPFFNVDATMVNIDAEPALDAIMGFKGSVKGLFKGAVKMSGAGILPEIIKKNLKGKMKFEGESVRIRTFNILDGLKKALNGSLLDKLDFSKKSFDEGIDKLLIDATIANEKAEILAFDLSRNKQYSLSMKGQSTLDPILDLKGDLKIVEPLSLTVAGDPLLKPIFVNKQNEILIPFYIKGPTSKLEYGIDKQRSKNLYEKKVLSQVKGKVVEKAKELIKDKKVEEKIMEKVPEDKKDKVNSLKKKFGF